MGGDPRLVGATARENGPGDAGELVGERDRQHVAVEPLRCPLDPGPQTPHCCTRPPYQDNERGLHEQCPQVLVAALGDLAQDRAVSRRLLLRHQPQPGAEVASLLEPGAIADRRYHRARDDRADPRHGHQALAAVILLRQRFDLGRHSRNALVQPAPVLRQIGDEAHQPWRERASLRAQDIRQRPAQGHYALPHYDAALDEEAADLIDHTRTLADKARAHAMQSQQIHLLWRLDRHEVHGRPLHRFRNRLGIAVVVLVTLEERLHVLRRDQTRVVAERCKLPADVMRARAGLHADQAARNIGETAFELTTRYLLLQDDYTPLIEANEVEGVLAEVDPDRGDDSSCLLRCAHRMLLELCFTPPS